MIVIDEQGIVRYRRDPETPAGFASVDDLKAALDALPG